ncbi:MAG: hypothetical protein WBA74_27490 [Cyclobacteriaceae bacterium]
MENTFVNNCTKAFDSLLRNLSSKLSDTDFTKSLENKNHDEIYAVLKEYTNEKSNQKKNQNKSRNERVFLTKEEAAEKISQFDKTKEYICTYSPTNGLNVGKICGNKPINTVDEALMKRDDYIYHLRCGNCIATRSNKVANILDLFDEDGNKIVFHDYEQTVKKPTKQKKRAKKSDDEETVMTDATETETEMNDDQSEMNDEKFEEEEKPSRKIQNTPLTRNPPQKRKSPIREAPSSGNSVASVDKSKLNSLPNQSPGRRVAASRTIPQRKKYNPTLNKQ